MTPAMEGSPGGRNRPKTRTSHYLRVTFRSVTKTRQLHSTLAVKASIGRAATIRTVTEGQMATATKIEGTSTVPDAVDGRFVAGPLKFSLQTAHYFSSAAAEMKSKC